MEAVPAEMFMQALYTLVGAGALYGGIRADLKAMHEKVAMAASSATRAHERIDNLIGGNRGKKA